MLDLRTPDLELLDSGLLGSDRLCLGMLDWGTRGWELLDVGTRTCSLQIQVRRRGKDSFVGCRLLESNNERMTLSF